MEKKYPAFKGKAVKKLADGTEEVFVITLWTYEPRQKIDGEKDAE